MRSRLVVIAAVMAIAVVGAVAAVAPARAEGRIDLHAGGGLEGGMITGEPRPDGVLELGVGAQVIIPGKRWGLGVAVEQVERLTDGIGIASERKADAMLRFVHPQRRGSAGVGAGVRWLTTEAGERMPRQSLAGIDFVRLAGDLSLTSWAAGRARLGVDAFFTWTFGCYRGALTSAPVGDMIAPSRTISCVDSLTSTYVFGLQTSMSWK